MKKLLYFTILMLAVFAMSCNGTGENSAKTSQEVSQDTSSIQADSLAPNSEAQPLNLPTKDNATPAAPQQAKPLEKPTVPVTSETPTDRLLKQYSEALIALIEASHSEKGIDDSANQKFLDLQGQLEKLEKGDKLSTTQKELFKATNEAYTKLKSK